MEARRPPEYTLEVFADPTCVKEVVKAILHTIFFHRYFIPIAPKTKDLLDQTLPAVDDVHLETLIDQTATTLVRALEGTSTPGSRSGRAQIGVSFYEKRRRKSYFNFGKTDEEICWELWTLDVTCAAPRTESDARKVRVAMENTLRKTALKIIGIVNREKDHIPPITTTDTNPFPYKIQVNPKDAIGARQGIF